ncbi:hypothetical protein P7633_26 [Streptococcus phage P7633]|uniref:Uncharacterized protein n=1 Tax=Streptococcus phage P7633 TaxID=1971435 RepID=A0A286QS45_9CAUD|nr:hypothetical protein PP245_gp26 [Streptococcus phage P7633]ARU14164.1 hypothetical protein P7633_26 [Streptococcus phage P7633]
MSISQKGFQHLKKLEKRHDIDNIIENAILLFT